MKRIEFVQDCDGIGLSRVARDYDMAETIGFYKNEYQMYYILDGERYFYMNETCFLMKKGTLTLVDKKQIPFTNIIGGKSHERFLAEFEEQWLKKAGEIHGIDFLKLFGSRHGVYELNEKEQEFVEKSIRKIENILREEHPYAGALVKNILLSVTIPALSGMGRHAPKEKPHKGKMLRYIKVREIINYIMIHYAEVNGLEEIAQTFYIDKSYLSRIFKEAANFTVNEFINFQRIEHARSELLEEGISIEEVSKKLGYKRVSYFDRVFKKYVGMSPMQYRSSVNIVKKTGKFQ